VVGEHRVESSPGVARIAVLQAGGMRGGSRDPQREGVSIDADAAGGELRKEDTLRALGHIGAEVQVLAAVDVRECIEFVGRADVDLAVLDRCDPATVMTFFEAQAAHWAPAIVVIPQNAPESAALDAFRLGAGDCIRAGQDYAEVLPLVAMEQIHRWRQLREREAARSKIQWLENLNEAIVSEIPVALAVLDETSAVMEINPEFQRSFGFSPESARRKRIAELLPADLVENGQLLELVLSRDASLPQGPRLARMVDGEGRDRIFDVRSQRLDAEGHILLTLSDVSQAEFLSRRVDELERFNEHVIQSINSALVVIDLSGKISYANSTAAELVGQSEDELKGEPSERFFPLEEGTSPLVARVLQEGVRVERDERMLALANGRAIPIGISCTPLLDEDGEVQGAVAIFQDLSEIKELQRQVLQQEKMASIGQLAAGIAHEINNPVGFIHANLAQMAEYLGDLAAYLDSVDGLQRALRESLEGSERIRHIVSDLRDFSHQGGLEMDLADLNQCVDSTANIVLTMMKHSIELRKNYEDLPELRCHPMQLKQVFMNLLVNAYQAIEETMGEGGAQSGVIEISTRRRDGGIEVAIQDTGSGIAEADLPRIFDPFYTTKGVGAGTGLGLSTSYGIVKQHGGEMAATSEPGRGARFEVMTTPAFFPPCGGACAARVGRSCLRIRLERPSAFSSRGRWIWSSRIKRCPG